MNLKPFFCFYGGKWRAAPKYPKPEHNTIVEPFAGAAGYSTRYSDCEVILVEKDPVIASLWRYLISVSASEILQIPFLANDQSVDDLKVCTEAKTLVGFWLNKGASAPRKTPSKWMRDGSRPKNFWGETIRERIAAQVEHIRHWKVIEGSYDSAPRATATWFVDPPYQNMGKHYKHSTLDFEALAEWTKGLPGTVIACEQVGADWLPFRPFATIVANRSKTGKKTSAEAIYFARNHHIECAYRGCVSTCVTLDVSGV